jgi:hypothetical protein
MKKFEVAMWRTYGYTVTVEADYKDTAEDIAFESWDHDRAELLSHEYRVEEIVE